MPPHPPRDRPGPHPENQRKRTELRGPRRALIGLLALIAALATAGGVALLLGQRIGVRVDSSLASPRVTGVVLALLVGATQAAAAFLLVLHHVRARATALVVAVLVGGWGVVQMMVDGATWFSLALFGIGALEILLVAACTPRKVQGLKKMRGNRR